METNILDAKEVDSIKMTYVAMDFSQANVSNISDMVKYLENHKACL
jgi:hypothetical protein